MGTTADKLNKILQSKQAIKAAIEAKGVADVGDIMSLYADKIASIQSGGTETKYTGHADTVGLKAIGWSDEDIQYYQTHGVNWNEEDDEYHKVPQDNIALYGVLNENNIQDYRNLIVYLPKIEITKTSLSSMFSECKSMVAIAMLDTSNVTNMSNMFSSCFSLVSVPQLDLSKVVNCEEMFANCYSLAYVPQLNTSKASSLNSMFIYCYSLEKAFQIDCSSTSTYSGYAGLFGNCYQIQTIEIINAPSNTMLSNFLASCYSLIKLSRLDLKSTTNFHSTKYLYSLREIEIVNLNMSLDFSGSALLSKESLLYMIQNAAPTSAITITLHSNVYNKYIEDTDIVSALEAQPNITLAK